MTAVAPQPAHAPSALTRAASLLIYALLRLACDLGALLSALTRAAPDLSATCPPHVALAARADTAAAHAAIARLALTAERLGAAHFSVCALYGSAPDAPAAIHQQCHLFGVRIDVRVRPPAPRAAIVRYTRALAATPMDERDCDVNDADSVVRSIDSWHAEHELVGEPDVLVVAPGHAHCMASFSVWQLRLTQLRFARYGVEKLPESMFGHLICSAYGVAKRFGK